MIDLLNRTQLLRRKIYVAPGMTLHCKNSTGRHHKLVYRYVIVIYYMARDLFSFTYIFVFPLSLTIVFSDLTVYAYSNTVGVLYKTRNVYLRGASRFTPIFCGVLQNVVAHLFSFLGWFVNVCLFSVSLDCPFCIPIIYPFYNVSL